MAYNYLLQSFRVLNREGALTDVGIKPEDLTNAIMSYDNPQDGWDKETAKLINIEGLDSQTRASLNITLGTISDERRKINQAPYPKFFYIVVCAILKPHNRRFLLLI